MAARRTSPAREVEAVAEKLHSAALLLLRRLRTEGDACGISPPCLAALSVVVDAGPIGSASWRRPRACRPRRCRGSSTAWSGTRLVRRTTDPGRCPRCPGPRDRPGTTDPHRRRGGTASGSSPRICSGSAKELDAIRVGAESIERGRRRPRSLREGPGALGRSGTWRQLAWTPPALGGTAARPHRAGSRTRRRAAQYATPLFTLRRQTRDALEELEHEPQPEDDEWRAARSRRSRKEEDGRRDRAPSGRARCSAPSTAAIAPSAPTLWIVEFGRQDELERPRRDPTDQVERQIAELPERILDVVAEDPEEQHVAAQVQPARVQEHRADASRARCSCRDTPAPR